MPSSPGNAGRISGRDAMMCAVAARSGGFYRKVILLALLFFAGIPGEMRFLFQNNALAARQQNRGLCFWLPCVLLLNAAIFLFSILPCPVCSVKMEKGDS